MNKQIIDEAAEWFIEFNQDQADRATRQKFDAWLRQSPEHMRAYLNMLPIWERGSRLDVPEVSGDPQALIAWARAGDNVVPLEASRSESPTERWSVRAGWTGWLAVAASMAVMVLGGWVYSQRNVYTTDLGEQRLIALDDGSKVELNSRSRLKVRFTARGRDVDLLEGQALFSVARDASRPFVVHSAETKVRAVGTQFDVYRKRIGTIVTVLEGRVAVVHSEDKRQVKAESVISRDPVPVAEEERSTVYVTAGEQLRIPKAKRTSVPQPAPADVAMATAWTQQRLVFSRTPLTEVAEEFNRYNERRLVVADGELDSFNVSGTFLSTDPDSLLRFLRKQSGIQIVETASEIRISEDR